MKKIIGILTLLTVFSVTAQATVYSCEEIGIQILVMDPKNEGDKSPYQNWYSDPLPTSWSQHRVPFDRLAIKTGRQDINKLKMFVSYYKLVDERRQMMWSTSFKFSQFIGFGTYLNPNSIVGNPVDIPTTRPGVYSFVIRKGQKYICSTRMNVSVPEEHP